MLYRCIVVYTYFCKNVNPPPPSFSKNYIDKFLPQKDQHTKSNWLDLSNPIIKLSTKYHNHTKINETISV